MKMHLILENEPPRSQERQGTEEYLLSAFFIENWYKLQTVNKPKTQDFSREVT